MHTYYINIRYHNQHHLGHRFTKYGASSACCSSKSRLSDGGCCRGVCYFCRRRLSDGGQVGKRPRRLLLLRCRSPGSASTPPPPQPLPMLVNLSPMLPPLPQSLAFGYRTASAAVGTAVGGGCGCSAAAAVGKNEDCRGNGRPVGNATGALPPKIPGNWSGAMRRSTTGRHSASLLLKI